MKNNNIMQANSFCCRLFTFVRECVRVFPRNYSIWYIFMLSYCPSLCVRVNACVRLNVTFLFTMILFTQSVKQIFVFLTACPAVLVHRYQYSSNTQFCNAFCNPLATNRRYFVTVLSFEAVWSRLKYFKA